MSGPPQAPDWTDHNDADPGITLAGLPVWMGVFLLAFVAVAAVGWLRWWRRHVP